MRYGYQRFSCKIHLQSQHSIFRFPFFLLILCILYSARFTPENVISYTCFSWQKSSFHSDVVEEQITVVTLKELSFLFEYCILHCK